MWKDFTKFLLRGNVVDLAVAVVIGAAFGAVVKSLVDDVVMPPIGLLIGDVDFSDLFIVLKQGQVPGPYESLAAANAAGAVTLRYGVFITTLITFVIIGAAIFLLVRVINRMMPPEEEEEATYECPYCASTIARKASKCPNCTSTLSPKNQ